MSDEDERRTLWNADFRDWIRLQRGLAQRLSGYLASVGELAASGSIEPRGWIKTYATLWSGVIGEVGDWMQRGAEGGLRPTEEWLSRARGELPPNQQSLAIEFEVPLDAFGEEDEITLRTDGFRRPGGELVLRPGQHGTGNVEIVPPVAKVGDRRSEIKLFGLRAQAAHPLPRGLYLALVWAERPGKTGAVQESRRPVALIELEVLGPGVRRRPAPAASS